ncbi:MAG: hypothetical protein RL329_1726 [Bacteroidota bacterium]|jgi:hypothetical protein
MKLIEIKNMEAIKAETEILSTTALNTIKGGGRDTRGGGITTLSTTIKVK